MSVNGIKTLTNEEVINIHISLTHEALDSEDPISPPGIKSMEMLESAVARQEVGYGGRYKYDTPISNAATLCYGVCCNHSFHNGNKRAALVSLLCHLDKNDLTFKSNVDQDILYSFMLKIASHTLVSSKKLRRVKDQSDAELGLMNKWLIKKTRKYEKGERSLSYREFEKVLKEFDVYFEDQKGNYIDVIKYQDEEKGIIFKKKVRTRTKVANIPYFPGRSVGKVLVKSVRKQAGLTIKEGIDSAYFYGKESTPDEFIVKYKKTLRKLAKT